MINSKVNYQKALSCLVCWLACLLSLPVSASPDSQLVMDLAGREVRLPAQVKRLILGESRYIPALAILDKEQPLKRVVGMLADFKQTDPGSYAQYQQRFPEIDAIPQVGHTSADSFSAERVLTLHADVAVFGLEGHGPTARNAELIAQLQAAGVAVVFVDFRQNPLVNTVKSMALLGKILGREAAAKEFIDFYQEQLARVEMVLAQGMAQQTFAQPEVFLHSRVGIQDLCCETMVRGMMATFIEVSRGQNIARDLIPGQAGVMNLEYLITRQPEIYIATAIGSAPDSSASNASEDAQPKYDAQPEYIVLGAGVDASMARASFASTLGRSGVQSLNAVQTKRAYAIWHHFYNTPLNVVAVQVFAKWLHPEVFSELNPRQTLQDLFDRFQPVPLAGVYWTGL